MEQFCVKVTYLHDSMDCETCGGGYASGWLVECEKHPEANISLIPSAHCYDSVDYDYVENVFREWIKNGIVIADAPVLTEDQLNDWDFMRFLMPDLYQVVKQSYTNTKGDVVFYDEVICKVDNIQLIEEYLSRVYKSSVTAIRNNEYFGDYGEYDD
ncbi:hypothetical protein [Providencia phage PSTCR5]|uniref:Uncharacterized protein n=1 Tax=Providencia phage PSTCR5 TaxID=2783547 RepID=A0A873WQE2_9CAUD|nr:hypothetical protein KNV68_gp133 [Providencia phage PSTCR5]QPB12225.1 hypothetical protein [Providencia phage PSTCR5]